ncbi:hypothetical protein ACIBI7_24610 [Nonomuraea fuscirosea]|uniref:hypothetical protein n=1 Tax=Nonomuraea fuscirosea TaxID=1291556 RepID=UPI003791486B
MKKTEIAVRHGIGVRQLVNIVSAVEKALQEREQTDTSQDMGETCSPVPLVAAEIEMADQTFASDGQRALETLRSLRNSGPVTRSNAAGPTPGAARVRQHRMRRSISDRINLLQSNPDLSVAQPYLLMPWVLPRSLEHLVPSSQQRRGKLPEEDWLARLTDQLRQSYERKDGQAYDLSRLALWGFSKFPQSPLPEVEAEALRHIAVIERERGSIKCYWLYRRVCFLVGSVHPISLILVADAAITLRNHGYGSAADRLLRSTLAMLDQADILPGIRILARWRILDQLAFNYSRSAQLPLFPDIAAKYADALSVCSEDLGRREYRGVAHRRYFSVKLAHAILRAKQTRERAWLSPGVWEAFAEVDKFSLAQDEEPIYRAQWSLERMLLGITLRESDLLIESARHFRQTLEVYPWIGSDHPNETYGYRLYLERAGRVMPKIRGFLEDVASAPGPAWED